MSSYSTLKNFWKTRSFKEQNTNLNENWELNTFLTSLEAEINEYSIFNVDIWRISHQVLFAQIKENIFNRQKITHCFILLSGQALTSLMFKISDFQPGYRQLSNYDNFLVFIPILTSWVAAKYLLNLVRVPYTKIG